MADKDDVKRDIDNHEIASADASPGNKSTRKSSGQRFSLLLLVLLLVLVGAVAWYINMPREPQPAPEVAVKHPVQSKTLPIPARDPAPAPGTQIGTPESVEKTADSAKVTEAPKPSAETDSSQTTKIPAEDGVAGKIAPPVQDKPLAVAPPAPQDEKTVPAAVAAQQPAAKPPASPAAEKTTAPVSVTPAPGHYTVQVGAFAMQSHLVEAQNKLRELGYPINVREMTSKITMIRLRVGTFFPTQGEAKMAEIRLLGGEPFFLMDKDLMIVYAGSFQSAAKARQFAATLQTQGVHVTEERVATEIPLTILRFGDFATRAEAEEAAARARQKKLDTLIVKTR